MLRVSFGLCAVLSVAIAGCGKPPDDKKAADAKANAPKNVGAPPTAVPVGPQGGAPAPALPKPQATSGATGAAAKPLPLLEPGFEHYEVAKEGPPAFEVVPQAEIAPSDVFAAVAPPAGANSNTFTLGPAAAAAPRTTAAKSASLPEGFTAIPESGAHEDGHPLRIRCDKDQSEMAYVPAGVVRLGLANGPPEVSPQLGVPLDPFYIDVTEVTVGQYEAYRTDLREAKKPVKQEPANPKDPPDFPVRGILWSDARFYAQWAEKTLPTEAQWEMAARGPDGYLHPWGNDRAVWPKARDKSAFSRVKAYRTDQSIYGVFDLAGNVREWVADAYSPTAFKDAQNAATSTLKNWEGPKKSVLENTRVVKGNGPGWSVWHRAGVIVREKPADVGFRCVLQLGAGD